MKYQIDKDKSIIQWTGSQEDEEQHGVVSFSSGIFLTRGGKIVGGSIYIDMQSIQVTDEDLDKDNKDMLQKHLRSKDFFDVEKNHYAAFEIREVKDYAERFKVAGEFVLKGSSFTIEFPAEVKMEEGQLVAKAHFTLKEISLDAYQFLDSNYGEGKEMPQMEININIKAIAV